MNVEQRPRRLWVSLQGLPGSGKTTNLKVVQYMIQRETPEVKCFSPFTSDLFLDKHLKNFRNFIKNPEKGGNGALIQMIGLTQYLVKLVSLEKELQQSCQPNDPVFVFEDTTLETMQYFTTVYHFLGYMSFTWYSHLANIHKNMQVYRDKFLKKHNFERVTVAIDVDPDRCVDNLIKREAEKPEKERIPYSNQWLQHVLHNVAYYHNYEMDFKKVLLVVKYAHDFLFAEELLKITKAPATVASPEAAPAPPSPPGPPSPPRSPPPSPRPPSPPPNQDDDNDEIMDVAPPAGEGENLPDIVNNALAAAHNSLSSPAIGAEPALGVHPVIKIDLENNAIVQVNYRNAQPIRLLPPFPATED